MPYIYENHLGGYYTSEFLLDDEDLYCETCGSSDQLIVHADTNEDALLWLEKDPLWVDEDREPQRVRIERFTQRNREGGAYTELPTYYSGSNSGPSGLVHRYTGKVINRLARIEEYLEEHPEDPLNNIITSEEGE